MIKIFKNVITLLLAFVFAANVFVIVRNFFIKDDIPSFYGYSAFLVQSENIRDEEGNLDYVVIKTADNGNFENGDLVAFRYKNVFTLAKLMFISYVGNDKYYNFSTYDRKYSYSNIGSDKIIGKSVFVLNNFGNVIMSMKSNYKVIVSAIIIFEVLILGLILRNNLLKKENVYEQ